MSRLKGYTRQLKSATRRVLCKAQRGVRRRGDEPTAGRPFHVGFRCWPCRRAGCLARQAPFPPHMMYSWISAQSARFASAAAPAAAVPSDPPPPPTCPVTCSLMRGPAAGGGAVSLRPAGRRAGCAPRNPGYSIRRDMYSGPGRGSSCHGTSLLLSGRLDRGPAPGRCCNDRRSAQWRRGRGRIAAGRRRPPNASEPGVAGAARPCPGLAACDGRGRRRPSGPRVIAARTGWTTSSRQDWTAPASGCLGAGKEGYSRFERWPPVGQEVHSWML